jgi:hypothetical protein
MDTDFTADIDAIQRIDAVPRILEIVCRSTGMGFAAVARASRTADGFVLPFATKSSLASPGGELVVVTTICHEIRQSHQAVAIDHVAEDEFFCGHHTPAQYGFASLGRVMAIWRGTSARLRRGKNVSSGHHDAGHTRMMMLSVAAHIGQAKMRKSKPGLSCSR